MCYIDSLNVFYINFLLLVGAPFPKKKKFQLLIYQSCNDIGDSYCIIHFFFANLRMSNPKTYFLSFNQNPFLPIPLKLQFSL
jgi:hypothetical protein